MKSAPDRAAAHFYRSLVGTIFWRWLGSFERRRLKRLFRERVGALTKARKFSYSITPPLPRFVFQEMVELARDVDPKLYPAPWYVKQFKPRHLSIRWMTGRAYARLAAKIGGGYTHWIVGPWLKQGGADLAILHHAHALSTIEGARILVLLTEPTDSPWLNLLPPSVTAIEFGKETAELAFEDRVTIFTRLIVQMPPQVLHVIHSPVAWEAIARHGRALRQTTRIFVSLYCDDYTPEGVPRGFARRYLPSCHQYLSKVICDSAAYPAKLIRDCHYSPDLFATIYLPTEIPDTLPSRPETLKRRILWAGRFDRQKRLDLVVEVAKMLPDCQFLIYGTVVLGADQAALDALQHLPNVEMRGVYKGFGNLPIEDVDLFLYTSQWDGMPNVVLEAAAYGLPIVASAIGGVPELIDQDKGYLVQPFDTTQGYVLAITNILGHPEEARHRADNALALVRERHRFDEFLRAMKSLSGYVLDGS